MMRIAIPTFHHSFRRTLVSLGILLVALFSLASSAGAAVDESINKNTWKWLFGATEAQVNSVAWLAADDDGDSITNQAELAAGTNPFDPGAGLRVTALAADATTVSLTFPTAARKLYTVEASPTLVP